MAQRVKGQEVEIIVLVNGLPQDSLTFCKSTNFAWKTEILQEGYLGETTDRYDTIFKGVSGKAEFHMDSPAAFDLIREIVDKARRRGPANNTRINIKNTVNFPSGRRARVIIKDVSFGELPIGFGSRADYGTFSLDFAASEGAILTT